jgi:hypothetical protein
MYEGKAVEGTFTWKAPDTRPAVSDSEKTEYTVDFTPSDTKNYALAECKVKLKVNKAEVTVTKAPKAKTGLVENGKAQELITAGTATGGTMLYALGKDEKTAPDASAFKEAIPSGTNAGTYYVWYMVKGDANHTDTKPAVITVEIKSKDDPTPGPAEKIRMLRLYNPNTGEHFYTGNEKEKDFLVTAGWTFEGGGFYALTKSDKPVYRLYNPIAGDHHYTGSAKERDYLITGGWKYEGIAWYASNAQDGVKMYRMYNPNSETASHHFTTSVKEKENLEKLGWKYEGIAFYACK